MTKSLKILVFSFTSILFLGSIAQAQVVAKAGKVSITKQEFEKSYKQALQNSINFTHPPTKEEHLEDMVRFQVGLQEAERIKLEKDPRVKQALELELYKGLLETKLGAAVDKINVSESEMKSYYAANPQMRSSHILIRFPIGATKMQIAEAQTRAQKAYKEVVGGGKKWDVLVRAYTDDIQTKATGGDIGYQTSSSIYPNYYNALKKLNMSQVSPPVQGLYGFHIIKKTGQFSYDRADKNLIKMAVFNKKRFDLLNKYFSSLKKKYQVSYNKDLL